MAAKNKSKYRRSRKSRIVDFRHVFELHVEGSLRRDELLQQVRELQAVGKLREARRVLRRAQMIQEHLTALANSVRNPHPHASTKPS